MAHRIVARRGDLNTAGIRLVETDPGSGREVQPGPGFVSGPLALSAWQAVRTWTPVTAVTPKIQDEVDRVVSLECTCVGLPVPVTMGMDGQADPRGLRRIARTPWSVATNLDSSPSEVT